MDANISCWAESHVAGLAGKVLPEAPLVTAVEARPLIPGLDLWDMWPLQERDGSTAAVAGGDLWMALSSPQLGDPVLRHFHARIRLIHRKGGVWRDLGNLLPDGFGPGNREWAGSAVRDGNVVTLFYTAAGRAGQAGGYQQRLFQTTGTLEPDGCIHGWSAPVESVLADGGVYLPADQTEGEPGRIWAFRDPAHFRDPANGSDYLAFTASLAQSQSGYRGAVGIARAGAGGWTLLPPLVHADGLNNELERPHVLHRDGHYYLFWSTQRSVFAPDAASGPNGLYGMVAESLAGPWRPLNGTGLVIANPQAEPGQCYSWWVTDGLDVISFIDHWGLQGRSLADDPALARASFGGTPAPMLKIALDGDRSTLLAA